MEFGTSAKLGLDLLSVLPALLPRSSFPPIHPEISTMPVDPVIPLLLWVQPRFLSRAYHVIHEMTCAYFSTLTSHNH